MPSPFFRKVIDESKHDISLLNILLDIPQVLLTDTEKKFIEAVKRYLEKYGLPPDWNSVIVAKYPEMGVVWESPAPLDFQKEQWYELRQTELATAAAVDLETAIKNHQWDKISEQTSKIDSVINISSEPKSFVIADHEVNYEKVGPFIETGIEPIDKDIEGLGPGEVMGLFARPGIGKTTLSLFLAWKAATTLHKIDGTSRPYRVLYIAGETYWKTVANRFLCLQASINPRSMRREVTPENRQLLDNAQAFYAENATPLEVYKGVLSMPEISNHIESHLDNYDLIIMDAIYKIAGSDMAIKEENVRIARLVQGVVYKAAHTWVKPMILTSQINRVGATGGEAITLSTLAYSDAFGQELDLVLAIDDYEVDPRHNKVLRVLKNRNGRFDGNIPMRIDYSTLKYSMSTDSEIKI